MMARKIITTLIIILAAIMCQSVFAKTLQPYITKLPNKRVTITYFKKGKTYKTNLISFDNKIYSQAYRTFLANQNISDAYVITTAAVAQRPNNLLWRKRLVQTARWNNLPKIALHNAIFLAEKHDVAALKIAITIAKQLNDNVILSKLYHIKISLKATDPQAWEGLIKSEEALGNPRKAIKQLQLAIQKNPKLFNYLQLAKLYQNIGDIEAEQNILKEAEKKFGSNPKIANRQAELLYSQGNIKGAYKELLTAFPHAKPNDYQYWQTFGQLAWTLSDFKHAYIAYHHLEKSNKLTENDLTNLIRILEKSNPKKAFNLSLQGWHKYQNDHFLIFLLNLTPQTKRWNTLAETLEKISQTTRLRLAQNPYYISTEAKMWGELGNFNKAHLLYKKAVPRFPESINLKYDYLWFLVDYKQKAELNHLLKQWHEIILKTPKLLQPAAAGYSLLDKPKIALRLYQREYKNHKKDYIWLTNLSDVLDAADEPALATQIRQYAWNLMLKRTATQEQPLNHKELINYATLAMHEAPEDWTQNIIAHLYNNYNDTQTKELLMAWALRNNNDTLAEYVWRFHSKNKQAPLWIQQTIALHNHDKSHMQQLLHTSAEKLPYRDRAIAARKVGEVIMAQDLAYRGLNEHQQDNEMYDIFTETMLASADKITIKQLFQQSGNVVGPKNILGVTLYPIPRTSFSPFNNIWRVRSKDKTQILTPMTYDRSTGLKAKTRYKKGYIAGMVGQRQSLDNFWFGTIAGTYRFTSKLNSKLSLGYNELNKETTPLSIAGMADNAKLSFEYQYTPRNSFNLTLNQNRYKSQDQVVLGSGQSAIAYYHHKFEFGYPDWNYTLFASTHRFHHSGRLSPKAQELVPANQTANINFYVPKNFTRYGVSFGVGQAYLESYTHAWRPFAEVSAFNSTRFGIGTYMDLGIAGSVFGRDHLALHYNRSIGVEATEQKDYMIGLAYEYYF